MNRTQVCSISCCIYSVHIFLKLDINEKEKASVPEAKVMFKQYNMKASRIVGQLLIQQNQSWYFTDIACETDVMEESE